MSGAFGDAKITELRAKHRMRLGWKFPQHLPDAEYCAHDGVHWPCMSIILLDALQAERTRNAALVEAAQAVVDSGFDEPDSPWDKLRLALRHNDD